MCTMFAKHPKKNILYRSIESSARRTILENSFLQSFAKKKMADVWLTLSLDHAILLLKINKIKNLLLNNLLLIIKLEMWRYRKYSNSIIR